MQWWPAVQLGGTSAVSGPEKWASMSLLREIQDGATGREVPLATVLRKCKILAYRLGHEPLSEWVDHELNGYPDLDELPEYRSISSVVLGDFAGPFGSGSRNHPIPPLAVEEKHRAGLFTLNLSDGVAAYEEMLSSPDTEGYRGVWPSNFVLLYQDRLLEGMALVQAWRPMSRATLAGLLDQVRNRILTFALEIEQENPDAGEAPPGSDPPVPQERVNQIFNQNIYGGSNVIAAGNENVISDFELGVGDWDELAAHLRSQGLPDREIKMLREAVDDDGDVRGQKEPGSEVKSWVGRITSQSASGMLKLASASAPHVVAQTVLAYIGVKPS